MFRPATLPAAVDFLAARPDAAPVAGGTDLMVDLRTGRSAPGVLVDLSALALAGITVDGETIRIGSTTTVRSLELEPILRHRAPAVVEAARVLGSVQIRNMATVGGNVCHASPAADLPPALMVHDSMASITGKDGRRRMPVADLFTGPGTTCLGRGDVLDGIELTTPTGSFGSCYLRQTVRWAMDLAGVGVAASLRVDDRVVAAVRVALGAVAPRPLLVDGVDSLLRGSPFSEQAATEAGEMAAGACSPITDARGTEHYRRKVVATLVRRALRIAAERAYGRWPAGVLAPTNGITRGAWDAEDAG